MMSSPSSNEQQNRDNKSDQVVDNKQNNDNKSSMMNSSNHNHNNNNVPTTPTTPILTPTKSKKKKKVFEVSFVSPVKTPRRNLPTRSSSFTSPTKTSKEAKNLGGSPAKSSTRFPSDSLSKSLHIPRNTFTRPHEVDGNPLPHWDPSNFKTERDATCRKVYIPKDDDLFQKYLSKEDYQVMRGGSASRGGGGGSKLLSQSLHSNLSHTSTILSGGTISTTTNTMEQPHFSKYNRFFPKRGYFCCKGCGNALYCVSSKFNNFDGYPAFGECIDGSLELITWEEQQKQREELMKEQQRLEEIQRKEEEKQSKAATKIQSFIRGTLTRIKLARTLDELINDLQHRKEQRKNRKTKKETREEDHFGADFIDLDDVDDEPWDMKKNKNNDQEQEEDEPWDMTLSRHSEIIDRMFFMGHDSTNTFNTKASAGKKSCVSGMSSTSGGSFFDDDDDSDDDSFASFGGDDEDDEGTKEKNDSKKGSNHSSSKKVRQRFQQHQQLRNQKEDIRNWLQEEKEEGRNEIHCHRCKSHIGSVKEKQSKGRKPGQIFKEHHRVNGRAVKYLEDDLPKRTNYQCTLLFANQSQARLMGGGLRSNNMQEKEIPEFLRGRASKPPGSVPFVSPRTQRKKGVLCQSSHNKQEGKVRAFPKNSALEKLLLSRTMH